MPGRTAGRDDTDLFVRTIVPIRTDHGYNDNIFNRSDCMPALFPTTYTFEKGDAKGIVENESCGRNQVAIPVDRNWPGCAVKSTPNR
jgi:hypothetical protein